MVKMKKGVWGQREPVSLIDLYYYYFLSSGNGQQWPPGRNMRLDSEVVERASNVTRPLNNTMGKMFVPESLRFYFSRCVSTFSV